MAKSVNNSQNTSRIILVIAGILVLSALGYFATRYFSERSESENKTLTIDRLQSEIQDLESSFETLKADQQMALADKDKTIEENEVRIKELLDQVNRYKRQKSSDLGTIRSLESRLQDTQSKLASYRAEIEELKALNADLTTQVETLTEQELRLRAENADLSQQSQETTQELEQTKQLASALKTKDFIFYNVKKGKEKQETEFRRMGMTDLKVCFTLIENLVASKGEKEVFLVVENPDGTINANFTEDQSGRFMYEGVEKVYSASTRIAFTGISQQVCVPYVPAPENAKWEKGVYYVSAFADGNLIGQSTFRVK
ncbi:MAG: hypothetical protein AAFP02_03715 [Bacteroidota bacterium]